MVFENVVYCFAKKVPNSQLREDSTLNLTSSLKISMNLNSLTNYCTNLPLMLRGANMNVNYPNNQQNSFSILS